MGKKTKSSKPVKAQSTRLFDLKKHVAAIHISADLSLVERKLANVLLLNAYDNLLELRLHSIPVPHLMAMLGWDESDNVEYLQNALETLATTPVRFNILEDGETSWRTMALISYGAIEKGVCSYSYAEYLAERMYNPEIYATINLGVQRQFDSVYALALYENCLRFKNVGSTGWWSLETYRSLVGATAKAYNEFRELNRVAIGRPANEINRVSDIRITPEFRRYGRKVSEVRFLVSEVPQEEKLGGVSNDAATSDIDSALEIRNSERFKKLRAHGIGERLVIAWIMQDKDRACATVEYVEARSRKGQIKGSTAGYIRTVFESGSPISSKSEFDIQKELQSKEAAQERLREEANRKKAEKSKREAKEASKAAILALSADERVSYARLYMAGDGAERSGSWNETKGDFREAMERIQFCAWLEKRFIEKIAKD